MAPISTKEGNKYCSKAENYTLISLTSRLCKVLEYTIHSNTISHLDQQRILIDIQHGFPKSQSYEHQLIETVNDLAKSLKAS